MSPACFESPSMPATSSLSAAFTPCTLDLCVATLAAPRLATLGGGRTLWRLWPSL